MKLKKRMKLCEKYSGSPDLPWNVYRTFPNIDIASTGICFSEDGDFVTREEAIDVLKYLLKELK